MVKTGRVEKTTDREYEVEERRYRTLESASLRLQKEAKGYLDSLRAMTASQMRIAETIDAFYGDSGAQDGVSRSYKQAVEDLDAETVKALDGPYRTTVLEPINRFCAYFPDINECESSLTSVCLVWILTTRKGIKKRNHKMLDYDAVRAKVKKLVEKPDKDPTKLPRTEKEQEMVSIPLNSSQRVNMLGQDVCLDIGSSSRPIIIEKPSVFPMLNIVCWTSSSDRVRTGYHTLTRRSKLSLKSNSDSVPKHTAEWHKCSSTWMLQHVTSMRAATWMLGWKIVSGSVRVQHHRRRALNWYTKHSHVLWASPFEWRSHSQANGKARIVTPHIAVGPTPSGPARAEAATKIPTIDQNFPTSCTVGASYIRSLTRRRNSLRACPRLRTSRTMDASSEVPWPEQLRMQRLKDWHEYVEPSIADANMHEMATIASTNSTAAPSVMDGSEGGHELGRFGDLEVDTDPDRDSTLGDDSASYTTSLNSEVTNYKFEHGRRYHAFQDEKYPLPNDDEEVARLELQSRIWHLSLSGRLHLAPLPAHVSHALDIGCGTGSWCIEFAEQHPECQIVGTDLSPIQPTMVPPNIEFLIDDITSEWLYPQKFDYIHSRMIILAIKDWSKLVDEVWKNLKPGGWVEFQEFHTPFGCDDGSLELGPHLAQWNRNLCKAAVVAGTKMDAILGVEDILKARGFVSTRTATTKWALGQWPKGKKEKKIGEMFGRDVISGAAGISQRMFTKFLGMTTQEVSDLVRGVEEDVLRGKTHAYMNVFFLWAQKPMDTQD
nr:protein hob3 [Quercus suber]